MRQPPDMTKDNQGQDIYMFWNPTLCFVPSLFSLLCRHTVRICLEHKLHRYKGGVVGSFGSSIILCKPVKTYKLMKPKHRLFWRSIFQFRPTFSLWHRYYWGGVRWYSEGGLCSETDLGWPNDQSCRSITYNDHRRLGALCFGSPQDAEDSHNLSPVPGDATASMDINIII